MSNPITNPMTYVLENKDMRRWFEDGYIIVVVRYVPRVPVLAIKANIKGIYTSPTSKDFPKESEPTGETTVWYEKEIEEFINDKYPEYIKEGYKIYKVKITDVAYRAIFYVIARDKDEALKKITESEEVRRYMRAFRAYHSDYLYMLAFDWRGRILDSVPEKINVKHFEVIDRIKEFIETGGYRHNAKIEYCCDYNEDKVYFYQHAELVHGPYDIHFIQRVYINRATFGFEADDILRLTIELYSCLARNYPDDERFQRILQQFQKNYEKIRRVFNIETHYYYTKYIENFIKAYEVHFGEEERFKISMFLTYHYHYRRIAD